MNHKENLDHNPPFRTEIGEEVGSGKESIVYMLGSEYVAKEARAWFPEEIINEPDPETIKACLQILHPRSEEYLKRTAQDYVQLKRIFGNMLLSSVFVRGYSGKDGEPINYIVQKRVIGKMLGELGDELYGRKDESLRAQFLAIVWGAKKAFIEMGVPVDLGDRNVMREDSSGTVFFIDPASPSNIKKLINSKNEKAVLRARLYVRQRIEAIKKWVDELDVTQEERATLDKRFGITETMYQARIEDTRALIEAELKKK